MSHPGAKEFLQKNADAIAQMGVDMNIKNYVAPATRLDRLREIRNIVSNDAYIISPGVGKQGGDAKKTLKYANAIIVGKTMASTISLWISSTRYSVDRKSVV